MRYLSVCSGIEAASAAWGPLGWNAVGFSEIEPFPCSVLAHHYPDVPNYGDMTRYKEWDIEPGSIDVLVGGTPCQSFSIAGLRGGLEDARGNLALTFCGILDRFKPKWFIWENVPGVLSSKKGEDFKSLLNAFEDVGYIIDAEILDAQYFGVPQRRRRVFVCGENAESLLKKKTVSSVLTMAQCLLEILHASCRESLCKSENELATSDSVHLSKDGVRRRMKLFGITTDQEDNSKNWQKFLEEEFLKCRKEVEKSVSERGERNEKERTPDDLLMGFETEALSTLTEESWRKDWEESLKVARSFITKTSTSKITQKEIFTCFRVVLNIGALIVHLRKSSPISFGAGLSAFAALQDFTNYARQANRDLFTDMDGVPPFSDLYRQARCLIKFVGCFGDWRRAAQVIFEPDCLSGNFKTGRKSRKAVAALTATGVGTCGADDNQGQAGHLIPMTQFGDKAGTLTQRYDSSPCHDRGQNIVFDVRNGSGSEVSQTLQSHHSGSSLNTMPVVIAPALTSRPYSDRAAEESKLVASTVDCPVAYQQHGSDVGRMGCLRKGNGDVQSGVPFIAASTGEIAHCLNAGGMGRQDYETETMVVAFDTTQVTSKDNRSNPQFGDPCHPLVSHGHPPAIAVLSFRTAGDGAVYDSGDRVAALTTNTDPCANVISFSGRDRGDDGRGYGREPNVTGDITETIDATKPPRVAGPTIGVRRLSVTECERLQGFPDDYTNVPHRGKKAADGPRYKAIGNSMAVPVVRWLGERIMQFNV